ncbi:MAG: radical SAM protein [Elusimicrobiota bacterium]|nr:MAG: radical SAM protein [Elusimicrobiota bacterium]
MSRLTALAKPEAVDVKGLSAFNFRDMGGWHLLTNEWGHYLMMSTEDFERFMAGKVSPDEPLHAELEKRGFVKDRLDFGALAAGYVRKNSFQWFPGPSLHMIVVTLRCNQKCQYCHSSVVDPSRTDTDMDLPTAKKTVDFIFQTPNPTICIEFQGGEPLLNWPVVKFITEYAQAKAKATGRKLLMSLVCNFTLMTEEKLEWLLAHEVSLCTSLDGPAELHNKNRPFFGGGEAQPKVVAWLEKIQKRCADGSEKGLYLPGALMTTTRFSLPMGKEIVDLYVKLGMEQIFLRPLSPIGYAKRVWGRSATRPPTSSSSTRTRSTTSSTSTSRANRPSWSAWRSCCSPRSCAARTPASWTCARPRARCSAAWPTTTTARSSSATRVAWSTIRATRCSASATRRRTSGRTSSTTRPRARACRPRRSTTSRCAASARSSRGAAPSRCSTTRCRRASTARCRAAAGASRTWACST